MDIIEIILVPFYVLFFFLIFKWRQKKITDPVLRSYLLKGFWVKVFSSFVFALFVYFIAPGDVLHLYFPEGVNIAKMIMRDPGNIKMLFMKGADFDNSLLTTHMNIGYFRSESNYFVCKMVTVLSFFCFQKFLLINLCFSIISYSGVWQLFKFFYRQYPHLHKKIALCVLYLPSFVFWSSGILKDPICTGMLGFLAYSLYMAFVEKKSVLKNILIAYFAASVLLILKGYIFFSFFPFFLYFLCMANIKKITIPMFRYSIFILLLTLGIVTVFFTAARLKEAMGSFALDEISQSVKNQQDTFTSIADQAESSFTLGVEFDGTPESMVKMAPAAIAATLFRPYIWEARKVTILMTALESLAFMFLTISIFLKQPFLFIRNLFGDPLIFCCFFFAIFFALFVGATTLNFGTLVRYKIPCIPFYLFGLLLIDQKIKEWKLNRKMKLQPLVTG